MFAVAFLAATLFPAQSEAVLVALVAEGEHSLWGLVGTATLGNSLLHGLPEADPQRIGVCGVSWGGVITSMMPVWVNNYGALPVGLVSLVLSVILFVFPMIIGHWHKQPLIDHRSTTT